MDISEIDLSDRAIFRKGFPHALFARLREEAPVFKHEMTPGVIQDIGHDFWVTSRMDVMRWVSKDFDTFSSVEGPAIRRDAVERRGLSIVGSDHGAHSRLRGLVNRGFTPRMINRLQDRIDMWADRIVDSIVDKGECEFVDEVAYQLPMHLIADIVGIPESDRKHIFDCVSRFMAAGDPELGISAAEKSALEMEMFSYAGELTQQKRKHPADDVWTKIAHAEFGQPDGSKTSLSDFEMQVFFQVLAIAGSETTRNAISAGLLAFLDHPDQMEGFRTEPSVRDTGTREIIRWTSPVLFWARDTRRDIEIEGVKIPAGDRVSVWLSSANRDPAAFETDPDIFDIARQDNHHASFGAGGAHYCLGANLATRNVRVLFEKLFERVRDIEVAGDIHWNVAGLGNNVCCSIGKLPIRFRTR